MNIYDALHSKKAFANPDMIGAYKLVDDHIVHRDHIPDFDDVEFIINNAHPIQTKCCIEWIGLKGMLRNDWYLVE